MSFGDVLLLVLNTHAFSGHPDDLRSTASANEWCRSHGFDAVGARDLAVLRALRDDLRAAIVAGAVPPPHPALRALAAADEFGALRLDPVGRSVIAAVAVGVLEACRDDTWRQLRACANHAQCGVVFRDHSRNGSRRWCDVKLCGNRLNTRAFRERRRSAADELRSSAPPRDETHPGTRDAKTPRRPMTSRDTRPTV